MRLMGQTNTIHGFAGAKAGFDPFCRLIVTEMVTFGTQTGGTAKTGPAQADSEFCKSIICSVLEEIRVASTGSSADGTSLALLSVVLWHLILSHSQGDS